ncbi:MAG TPA: hypothetical protein VF179_19330 [Thermoanaerobaculia bacterium]|nr:hypothetical protein [Thermoanaerobaculia bacterium]
MSAPPRERGLVPRIAALAAVLFAAAATLTAKTAWDLLPRARSFPSWFVPAFLAGTVVLALAAGLVTLGIWRSRRSARPADGRLAAVVWILLPLSCVCTSTGHQLYPFRLSAPEAFREVGPMLGFNLALTGIGFLAAAALAVLYRSGRRQEALLGLMALGFVLLVPNDDCPNPFNETWLATVGASPLMFLPNLYASLFGLGALLGYQPRWSALALAGTCVAVALLGIGHSAKIIW